MSLRANKNNGAPSMHNLPPHTVSVDQIVGRLLQLWRADKPFTLSDNPSEVMTQLEFDKERAQDKLAHATKQAAAKADIVELQRNLDVRIEYLGIGSRLDAVLSDAVQARRDERDTGVFTIVLHAEENDPYQHQECYFTIKCIYDWAMDEYGIDVPEWAPAQRSTEANAVEAPKADAKTPKYTDLEREKHEVIIALLLEELATALKGNKYVENGHPHFTLFGERIAAKCIADNVVISGLSKEKLRKKFSDVMKTKKRYRDSK